jgi:hypothetical protein
MESLAVRGVGAWSRLASRNHELELCRECDLVTTRPQPRARAFARTLPEERLGPTLQGATQGSRDHDQAPPASGLTSSPPLPEPIGTAEKSLIARHTETGRGWGLVRADLVIGGG